LLLIATATGSAVAKPCVAPSRADLAGAWVADGPVNTYLLDLDASGNGVLVDAFSDSRHSTYDVTLARLETRRIEFSVKVIDSLETSLSLRGTTCRGYLWLEIGSRSPRWGSKLEFRPRDAMLKRIEAVTATANRLRTRSQSGAVLASRDESTRPASGACMAQSAQLVGGQPLKASREVAPKKTLHVAPVFPELPKGTTVGFGPWTGEVLIDQAGTVAKVWQLRGYQLTPAFNAFDQAVIDAIRQWRFEPLQVKGRATPVCMSVTTSIHLQ
jgi:hypothetical protein